jgi:hypothetical protein
MTYQNLNEGHGSEFKFLHVVNPLTDKKNLLYKKENKILSNILLYLTSDYLSEIKSL